MSRRVKFYTVPKDDGNRDGGGNRDSGKVFCIREASALRVERWCFRAIAAVARAGVDVTELQMAYSSGLQSVMIMGLEGLLKMDDITSEGLRAEMLDCVELVPDPNNPAVTRPLIEDDIVEIKTLLTLRSEIIAIHTGFSPADAVSQNSTSASQQPQKPSSPPTSTSPH